jgi:hypothetical protein
MQKERLKGTGLEKQMEEMTTRVQSMIDESIKKERETAEKRLLEERERADKKLVEEQARADKKLFDEMAVERARADKKLVEEQARADKEIAVLKQQLQQANDRGDEMHYKLNELDEVSKATVEWISTGVRSGFILQS